MAGLTYLSALINIVNVNGRNAAILLGYENSYKIYFQNALGLNMKQKQCADLMKCFGV